MYWLQKHNKYYSDVEINASNLDWLGENEGILEPENQMLPETYEDLMEDSIFDGPTEKQIPKPKNSNEEVEGEYGMMVIKTPPIGNDLEKEIADVLEDAAKKGNLLFQKIQSVNMAQQIIYFLFLFLGYFQVVMEIFVIIDLKIKLQHNNGENICYFIKMDDLLLTKCFHFFL